MGLLAGLPADVPGSTVSRMCASSLQAVRAGFHAIAVGESQVHMAAGVESVSRVGRTTRPEDMHPDLRGDPYADVYVYVYVYVSMGITAENVGRAFGVTRPEMDEFALQSHRLAVRAREQGVTAREIVPIVRPDDTVVSEDDGPRADTSLERLASLSPVFDDEGTVTAGNACPLNDGGVAVLLAGAAAADEYGLRPHARILATAVSGVAPELMGIGPIESVRRVLATAGLSTDDIDVVELNEAFAAQVFAVCRETGIDMNTQLNPHGGAIALGHPFGMTGGRLVGSLINDLEVLDGTLGLATLCVGGGQGRALVLERVG